ncbi:MAG: hypothetical protein JRG76_15695 [Deltaproteobacteria bacterium]|nr:hypothetical protein [Deltaproteobacteria bacterium]MBW2415942.1 hypothetical protein [Deltaproteobacteria bacterium]
MQLESERVRGWIGDEDVGALATYLMSGTHHGKPGAPQAVKLGVIALLREATPGRQLAWAKKLMKREEGIARSVACGLVAVGWERDAKGTAKRLRTLAEDPDWEVREWAAGGLADVLASDFAGGLALCDAWSREGEEASCRAVALALSSRSKERNASEAKPMLAIMERLLPLDGAYLQKNLGPFTLGGGFLSRFPDATLKLLRKGAGRKDENTRWNVAMAFTTAASRKHAGEGRAILDAFDGDDRSRVQRAVARARKNLSK